MVSLAVSKYMSSKVRAGMSFSGRAYLQRSLAFRAWEKLLDFGGWTSALGTIFAQVDGKNVRYVLGRTPRKFT
jgi:hypothetical protein